MGELGLAELPVKKSCGSCKHWIRDWLEFPEGLASAPCRLEEPKGLSSSFTPTRASFCCSKWAKRDEAGHEGEVTF